MPSTITSTSTTGHNHSPAHRPPRPTDARRNGSGEDWAAGTITYRPQNRSRSMGHNRQHLGLYVLLNAIEIGTESAIWPR
jgi:hypothetical protein